MERLVKGIWIPIEIWQDKSLSWNEKILLMEIDSFTSKGHECYISNEYIADLLGVSMSWASKCLSHLMEIGYVKMVKFDGRKRYVESAIQFKADLNNSSMQGGTSVQHTDNTEYININTLSNKGGHRFQKPSLEDVRAYCISRSNKVDPEQFFDHYESNGWMVGKSPMKDWRAAVRNWERRDLRDRPARKESSFERSLREFDRMYGTNFMEDEGHGKD